MRKLGLALAVALAGIAALWWWQPALFGALSPSGSPPRSAGPAGQPPGGQRPPAPVEVAAAETDRVADRIEALGNLSANENVAIAPEVGGRITALHFNEGQNVEAGALLVELDATIARAELEQARASLSVARDALERNQTLVQRGAGTQVSLEQAAAQLSIAQANLAASEARLEKLAVHAPFKGVAGLRSVSVGTIVTPGQSIASLTSVDPVKVDFGVPELFLRAIAVGQAIDVRIDAIPGRVFQGSVYAIDPIVDASGRALRLRATVPNPEGILRPGLFARVNLTTGVREDAVLVPETALIPSPTGETSAAYIVRENRATLVTLRTGRREAGRVEIIEGVSAGDLVVTAGQARLANGAPVLVTGQHGGVPAPRTAAPAQALAAPPPR